MLEFVQGAVPFITVLIAVVATVFLFSGVDDLLMDLFHLAWRIKRRLSFYPNHRELSRELLLSEPHQAVAVMVPVWQEAPVIRATLERAVEAIQYDNYKVFVGVYPNDPDTAREVALAQAHFPNRIRVVDVGHDGPTNKADCLNAIVAATVTDEQATGQP